jgi:hypothetical protein
LVKSFFFVSAVFAALTLAPVANASVCTINDCTYTFNDTGVSQFGAGPFGTVELTLSGSAIDFTIDLATGFHLIDSGAHEAFTFDDTLSGAVTISAFSDSIYSQASGAGPFGNPGYGSFSDAVKSTCTNGGGCGDNTLTFAVSRVGGFTDINQLVASNGTAYFAADVSNANGNTGAIAVTGVSTTSVIPEPVSSALAGTGLMSLFFLRRRRRA